MATVSRRPSGKKLAPRKTPRAGCAILRTCPAPVGYATSSGRSPAAAPAQSVRPATGRAPARRRGAAPETRHPVGDRPSDAGRRSVDLGREDDLAVFRDVREHRRIEDRQIARGAPFGSAGHQTDAARVERHQRFTLLRHVEQRQRPGDACQQARLAGEAHAVERAQALALAAGQPELQPARRPGDAAGAPPVAAHSLDLALAVGDDDRAEVVPRGSGAR